MDPLSACKQKKTERRLYPSWGILGLRPRSTAGWSRSATGRSRPATGRCFRSAAPSVCNCHARRLMSLCFDRRKSLLRSLHRKCALNFSVLPSSPTKTSSIGVSEEPHFQCAHRLDESTFFTTNKKPSHLQERNSFRPEDRLSTTIPSMHMDL